MIWYKKIKIIFFFNIETINILDWLGSTWVNLLNLLLRSKDPGKPIENKLKKKYY